MIDADGDLQTDDDQTPASGWNFYIGDAGPYTTDGDGMTEVIEVEGDEDYNISEDVQEGYDLIDASCTGADDNGEFDEEDDHIQGIEIEDGDSVVCTFINAPVVQVPACDLTSENPGFTTFDTFSLGSVNGQNSWSATGSYDQEVVTNIYGYPTFGCQSLRLSNGYADGAFGGQTFAAPVGTSAGESSVASNNHYEAQFDIASTMFDEQPDLALSVSPDDGNGSRMSYLGFADETGGIRVTFYDVTDSGPLGTAASFNPTDLGLLDRSTPHTAKFEIDFVDGPGNDVVKIYIDGSLVHTGTTWEDYYRYDPEQSGNGNQLFPVDTLIFAARGSSVPGNLGNGYLFDNLSLDTSNIVDEPEQCTVTIYSDTTNTVVEKDGAFAQHLSFIHSAWTPEFDLAQWIWGDDPVQPPIFPITQTFQKSFNWSGPVTSATLSIASDNTYDASLNANGVGDGTSTNNFSTLETYALDTSFVSQGANAFNVAVTNTAGATNPSGNPAGLLYKLEITGTSPNCNEPPEPAPICELDVELLENGGFETPTVTHASNWDIFASGTSGLGWLVEWFGGSTPSGGFDRPAIANIELQKNGLFAGGASEGNQWTELDSDWNGHATGPNGEPGAVAISQTVGTEVGKTYTFSFDFSPRPSTPANQNKVDVLVNGTVIDTVGPIAGGSATSWTNHSYSFVADSTSTTVTLRDAGTPNDSLGTFVDNASLMCTTPEPQLSTVTLCKYDNHEQPLPGWTLTLLNGEPVDSLAVNAANINGTDSVSLTGGTSYVALAGGVWLNDRNPDNHVDAEYSTEDGWATHMDGFTGFGAGILELEINETDGSWGPFNSLHQYAQAFVPATDGPANFRVFDGDTGTHTPNSSWYGDNKGSLNVDLYKGFSGITGENGCVVFENVPFGEYTAGEIEQEGWEFVSGPENPVQVDTELLELSLVNAPIVPPADTATINATKIVCDNESDLPNWGDGGADITASTAADFLDTHPNCHLEDGWVFEWAPTGTGNPGNNIEVAGGAWTPFPATISGVSNVTVSAGALVWVREQLQPGYIPFSGSTSALRDDYSAELYCNTDVLNYDNYDWIDPVEPNTDYYCVAFNVPTPTEPGAPTLTIVKNTEGGDGEFNFTVSGFAFLETPSITTDDGEGSAGPIELVAGTYSVLEDSPTDGWIYDGVECEYEGDSIGSPLSLGEEITVENGDSVICTFYNFKEAPQCQEGTHYDSEASECVSDGGHSYADLSVTKEVDDDTPDVGQQITYTITLMNNGPQEAGNIVVLESLPAGLAYVSHTASNGDSNYNPVTGEWDIASLSDEGVATLTLVMEVLSGEENESISNFASIEASGSIDDVSENDSDSVEVSVNPEDDPGSSTSFFGGNGPLILGLGGGGSVLGAFTSNGQVLGESCGLFMDQHLRRGSSRNNAGQVAKLQEFLVEHGFGSFTPTGYFGPLTEAAVKAFQVQYASTVLTPWGLSTPSGLVYLTTLRQINLVQCPDLSLQLPELVPWSQNPNAQ